ncbi:MAG: hypothetical protein J5716_07990 [Alphaproteobacteria bacterium]|nr:hypothetical protein [Alphaproteobacteria bacterium]
MSFHFFSHLRKYGVLAVKYSFFVFNLALLVCLSIKTVNLWIADPFDFADTLAAFPQEPELENKRLAENQFWVASSFETLLFIIGGFLCYELLIKQKTFRRNLIAPIMIAFLWATGESIVLFLPATEKVHTIKACQAMNISWDIKNHKCRLMDLELKRFEALKNRKKRLTPRPAPKETVSVKTETPAENLPPAADTKPTEEKQLKKTESVHHSLAEKTDIKPETKPAVRPQKTERKASLPKTEKAPLQKLPANKNKSKTKKQDL